MGKDSSFLRVSRSLRSASRGLIANFFCEGFGIAVGAVVDGGGEGSSSTSSSSSLTIKIGWHLGGVKNADTGVTFGVGTHPVIPSVWKGGEV